MLFQFFLHFSTRGLGLEIFLFSTHLLHAQMGERCAMRRVSSGFTKWRRALLSPICTRDLHNASFTFSFSSPRAHTPYAILPQQPQEEKKKDKHETRILSPSRQLVSVQFHRKSVSNVQLIYFSCRNMIFLNCTQFFFLVWIGLWVEEIY